MTAVRALRSTRYGAKLFAYLVVVVGIGAALLGVGYSLAWPEITAAGPLPGAVENTPIVAAGALAGGLGGFLIGSAVLGGLYKTVADGVAAGRAARPVGAELAADPGGDTRAGEVAAGETVDGEEPEAGVAAEPAPDQPSDPSAEPAPEQSASAGTDEPPAGVDKGVTAEATEVQTPPGGEESVTGQSEAAGAEAEPEPPAGGGEPASGMAEVANEGGDAAPASTGSEADFAGETSGDDGTAPAEMDATAVEADEADPAAEAADADRAGEPDTAATGPADDGPAEMSPGEIAFGSADDGPDPADTDPAEWFDTEPGADGAATGVGGSKDEGSDDASSGSAGESPGAGTGQEAVGDPGAQPAGQDGGEQVGEPDGTSADESTASGSKSIEPAGSSAPADPLADMRDEE